MINRPAQLTPFEWSMLQEDRFSSMTSLLVLCVNGELRADLFESALVRAIQSHPLLSAIVSPGDRLSQCKWVPSSHANDFIQFKPWDDDWESPWSDPIDLQSEPGIRVCIRQAANQSEIRFFFHHACCDGIGALRLIEDTLVGYDQGTGGEATLRPLKPSALDDRDTQPPRVMSLARGIWQSVIIRPHRVVQLLFRQPAPIAAPESPFSETIVSEQAVAAKRQSVEDLKTLPVHVCSTGETEALSNHAKSKGVSLNELLVRDLMVALYGWNQNSRRPSKQSLRILIPVSLRDSRHREMPAANCVSMTYITAAHHTLEDPESLLADISRQIKFIRRWQIEYSWNQSTALIASSRILTRLTRKRAQGRIATTVFSNLGRVFKQANLKRRGGKIVSGGLEVESIHAVPPLGQNLSAAFACHFYNGRLNLAMNYAQDSFDGDQADSLLMTFVKQLQSTAETIGQDWKTPGLGL